MKWEEGFDNFLSFKKNTTSPRWFSQLTTICNFWKKHVVTNEKEILDALLSIPVSNFTRNRYLLVLSMVKKWLENNGCDHSLLLVNIPKKLPCETKEAEIIPIEKIDLLINSATGWLKNLLLLSKLTLGRIGELLNLRWDDIDEENKILKIRTRKTAGKGVKIIYIPITPEIEEVLKRIPRKGVYVFPSRKDPSKPHSYPYSGLRKLERKCGVGIRGFHTIRHSGATFLLKKGVPLHVVQRLCGHSSITTTQRYLHVLQRDLEEAIKTLGEKT